MASEWAALVRVRVRDGMHALVRLKAQRGVGSRLGIGLGVADGPALERVGAPASERGDDARAEVTRRVEAAAGD